MHDQRWPKAVEVLIVKNVLKRAKNSVDQKSIPGDVLVEGDVRCWGGEAQTRASNFHHSIKEKGFLEQILL